MSCLGSRGRQRRLGVTGFVAHFAGLQVRLLLLLFAAFIPGNCHRFGSL